MAEGRVLGATEGGAYVLRLVGDVRLTLCATIDDYVESMLNDPEFSSVWVDLCDAEGVDSTTLGQLAKLALSVHGRYGFRPALYCCDAGLNRLVESMGLDRLFEMHARTCCSTVCEQSLPMVPGTEEEVRARVLDAHKVLMNMSVDNRDRFKDLVATLERC